MNNKRGQINGSNSSELKITSLRKITPSDRFPCFLCFDDPIDKTSCSQCKGNGWISGSHPMVQFAEDFIEKRLAAVPGSQMANSSAFQSDFGDVMAKMSGSYDPQKLPKDIYVNSSAKTLGVGDEIRQSRKNQGLQEVNQLYFCNECITQQAIKGKRYHCVECPDFDLCESCYQSGLHSEHKMNQFLPFKRPDNESLKAQAKLNILKRSYRNYK